MMVESSSARPRIGIVGGGIAGVGAAWALHRSGFDIELFERHNELGGNAKTFSWDVGDGRVESPLLVVAWPAHCYHNYKALLDELQVPTQPIPISYFVKSDAGTFSQDGAGKLERLHSTQFSRWKRLLRFIESVNRLFLPKDSSDSLYHSSYFNPMNMVSLYRLARMFGISKAFWNTIFVGVHCASFITTKMKKVPAVIGPLLESIVPLERPCEMETWALPPREVFSRMTSEFQQHVHTGHEITAVKRTDDGFEITDRKGRSYLVDKVVFACDSKSALDSLQTPSWLQRKLLRGVEYIDDVDPTFCEFVVHSDDTIFPSAHRERIANEFNTYSEFDSNGELECTFVLSSKYPGLNQHGVPMLVTFNSNKPIKHVQRKLKLPRAAHTVGMRNLAIMSMIRWLQGKDDVYFCGAFTTPEGGHDLSFLSGLVAAKMLGADYPFISRPHATADFRRMWRLMLGGTPRFS